MLLPLTIYGGRWDGLMIRPNTLTDKIGESILLADSGQLDDVAGYSAEERKSETARTIAFKCPDGYRLIELPELA